MAFKLQKIKNPSVTLESAPNDSCGNKTYWIYVNGKRAGLDRLEIIDGERALDLWHANKFTSLRTKTTKEMKELVKQYAYIEICHDSSFGCRIISGEQLKLMLAQINEFNDNLPLYELLPNEIEGDFTNKVYLE
jgi:hypothetical protein